MIYSSKEIALAAAVPDNLQFMQDIRRHNLPIHAKKFNGANRYDLTSFAVAMIVGELREYGISLASCGRLLSRIDLDDLSHRTEHLHQNIASEPCFLTPFAKIYWHSSKGLRQRRMRFQIMPSGILWACIMSDTDCPALISSTQA